MTAREEPSLVELGGALWSALNLQLKNWNIAYADADECFNFVTEQGSESFAAVTGPLRGWAVARMGQLDEGLFEILRYRTALSGTLLAQWVFAGLAEVYLAAGRLHECLKVVVEGLEAAQRTGTRIVEAELHRLKGEFLLLGDDGAASEAGQCFRDAIEVAHRQSAKSWELRATMSLARLLAKQGRRGEARAMLADIYNWFTEGFDTADLKDAKALLDELSI